MLESIIVKNHKYVKRLYKLQINSRSYDNKENALEKKTMYYKRE